MVKIVKDQFRVQNLLKIWKWHNIVTIYFGAIGVRSKVSDQKPAVRHE